MSNLVNYAFLWEKVETVDFSETIAASDPRVGRCRQLIVSIEGQGHFFTIYFQVVYVLCFTRPRYQMSVYRTMVRCLTSTWFILRTPSRYSYTEDTAQHQFKSTSFTPHRNMEKECQWNTNFHK